MAASIERGVAPAETEATDLARLYLDCSRLVTGLFAGRYRSVFRGRGLEFESVREYHPGDDVRNMDWNVTARTGRPHLKQFVEERELTLMLLCDLSPSLGCPTPRGAKWATAQKACALLAHAAAKSNDRIGLVTCTDRVESFVPPGKGVRQARRVVASLASLRQGRTDLAAGLRFLDRVARRASTVCIVSDFDTPPFARELAVLARRHEVVAFVLTDPADLELPPAGLLDLEDPETGRRMLLDTGSAAVRSAYRERALARRARLFREFAALGVRHLELASGEDPLGPLCRFFAAGQRTGRR